jgi:hypothetical protein
VKTSALKQKGGLTIERMVELGRVSRSRFYRFDGSAAAGLDPHMDLRNARSSALRWNGPATVARASPPNYGARAGP